MTRAGPPWRVLAAAVSEQVRLGAALLAVAVALQLGALFVALDVPVAAAVWRDAALPLAAATSIPVAMPTALAVQAWRWQQDGAWSAAIGIGVAPHTLALAAGLPWLPIVVVTGVLADRVVPAVHGRFEDEVRRAVFRDAAQVVDRLDALGIAAVRDERGGGRALVPFGPEAGGAVGVGWAGMDATVPGAGGDGLRLNLRSPRVADVTGERLRADGITIRVPAWRASLAERSERHLATATLVDNPARWQRARQARGPFPAAERARAEVWRRRSATVCTWAAFVLALAGFGSRPRPGRGLGGLALRLAALLAIPVLVPRFVGWLATAGAA